MKNLTKFQKQLIGIVTVAVVAAVLFAVYAIRAPKGDDKDKEPALSLNYAFTAPEKQALADYEGTAVFTFKAEQGKADVKTAYIMALAADYAALSDNITVKYGSGTDDCAITADGKTTVIRSDDEGLFKLLEDGTPYAFTARARFNTAIFGDPKGAEIEALKGYDLDGDVINSGGNIVLYTIGKSYKDVALAVVEKYDGHEKSETTFYTYKDSIYIQNYESMTVDSTTAALVMSFARSPVAVGKVENPADDLSLYGLDDENLTATLKVIDKDENVHFLRIGKALPDGSGGRYVMCDDKKHIYMSSNYVSYALAEKETFLTASYGFAIQNNTDVYTLISDMWVQIDEDLVKLDLLTEEEKEQYSLNYTWKLTSPSRFVYDECGYAIGNIYNVGDVFIALSNLEAGTLVSADVNEATLKEYGLDKPYRSYSWVYGGLVRCTVHFSTPDPATGDMYVYAVHDYFKTDGDEAVYEDGVPVIEQSYTIGIGKIADSDFSGQNISYINLTAVQYINENLFLEFFSNLDRLVFVKDGKESVFTFSKSEGATVAAKLDGESVDLQSVKYLYTAVTSCAVLGEYEVDTLPEESLRVILTVDGTETVISLTRVSTTKVYCTVNGKGKYYVSYDNLETLLSYYEIVLSGGTIQK